MKEVFNLNFYKSLYGDLFLPENEEFFIIVHFRLYQVIRLFYQVRSWLNNIPVHIVASYRIRELFHDKISVDDDLAVFIRLRDLI